ASRFSQHSISPSTIPFTPSLPGPIRLRQRWQIPLLRQSRALLWRCLLSRRVLKSDKSGEAIGSNFMARAKRYIINDGKLLLTLEEAEEGGFVVTSPVDPELITEAETIAEAFENARDALAALAASRRKLYAKFPAARRRIARSA